MPISIVVPQLGESVAEGTVSKWLKAQGDKVRKEEPLVEIQTDKINVEIPSPGDGILERILVAEGTTVLVGTEIAVLSGAGEPAAAPSLAAAPAPASAFLAPRLAPAAAGPREEVVPFSKVRKLIAENMVRAKHTAAHTHCFDETDMSAIVGLKREWGPKLEAQGVRLTYMPFFIKASVLALKEFPWVNGEVRGDTMVVKKFYNIGIAVGRDEKGLIVPNVKDCDRKNLVQIAAEVNDLAARARADRLKPDEIQGGTFSITNAGVYGAINSSPVINVPEVAILGVHKIVERPVIRDGAIVARPMMNASIGFDHRVVDGELAVKFLRRVCELLERPEMLWFHA